MNYLTVQKIRKIYYVLNVLMDIIRQMEEKYASWERNKTVKFIKLIKMSVQNAIINIIPFQIVI